MVNVLIVDDNVARVREITAVISMEGVNIEYVTTKNEALCKLESAEYDLAIIDIMLPENLSSLNPERTAGVELIKDISKRKRVSPPREILGITSDAETYTESKKFFDERLIPILIWQPEDTSWKEKILSRIEYLRLLKVKNDVRSVDVAIITAVNDEFCAVRECFENWEQVNVDIDPDTYFSTELTVASGKKLQILLALLPEMGMTAASNTATKVIRNFKPSKVFMVGICGGVRNEVNLCDIIVATSSWDYGSGKIKPRETQEGSYYKFEPSPNQLQIEPKIVNKLQYSTGDIISKITTDWNSQSKDNPIAPKLVLSPMPSGASVICDSLLFDEIIKPQHRKCKGIDMETYGIYYAIKHSSLDNIDFLSVKAVSDFADAEKNDNYHSACCYLSSHFLVECLKNEIL